MRKVSMTVLLDPEQYQRLKDLSKDTRVPMAELIRQGIEVVLTSDWAQQKRKLGATHTEPVKR